MRTEQELKRVNKLDKYFNKVIDQAANRHEWKRYDVLRTQQSALWEYCGESEDANDRGYYMTQTERYFKAIEQIIKLEQTAENCIQFG